MKQQPQAAQRGQVGARDIPEDGLISVPCEMDDDEAENSMDPEGSHQVDSSLQEPHCALMTWKD